MELRNPDGALCAGVWVGRTRILTAEHCVDGFTSLKYFTPNIKISRDADVIAADPDLDLAMLLVVGEPPDHPIALAGGLPAPGDTVYTMGHPIGLLYSFSSGEVAAVRSMQEITSEGLDIPVIQTTAPISPGNSGGGMFNERGELLGICSFTYRRGQNLNFYIPIGLAN